MRHLQVLVIFITLFTASSQSESKVTVVTANEVLKNRFGEVNTLLYLRGVVDGMDWANFEAKLYCPPSFGLVVHQYRAFLEEFVSMYPPLGDQPVQTVLFSALKARFPCKGK